MEIYTEASLRLMATSEDHYGMMLVSATCLYWSQFVQSFTEEVIESQNDQGVIEKKQQQRKEHEVKNSRVFVMAGWDDAPHLNDDEKKRFKANIPPHEIEARSRGVPSIGSGMVYPITESLITCDPFQVPDYWARVFAIDFGWNPSPTAVLFGAHDRDNDIIYLIGEYTQTERTPQQHVYELMNMGIGGMAGVFDPAGFISSQRDGSKLVDLYREAGLILSSADNSKEKGVQKVLQRMQNNRLRIFKTLNKTLSELRMYARDEEGIIKKGNDHLMDCMRYLVMSGTHVAQPLTKNTKNDDWDDGSSGGYI